MRRTHVRLIGILVIASTAILQPACASLVANTTAGSPQSEQRGTIGTLPRVLVGGGPFAVALDSVTHTA